ncbi:hypothetical protein WJ968_08175 [Achromobacter xylosoxidans]
MGQRARGGSLQTQDALRVAAGRDLALGGSLVMGDQDVGCRPGATARGRSGWRIAARAMATVLATAIRAAPATTMAAPAAITEVTAAAITVRKGSTGGNAGNGAGTSNGSGAGASTETAASTQSVGSNLAKGALTLQAYRDIQLPGRLGSRASCRPRLSGELSTTPARACNRARPWGYARARA